MLEERETGPFPSLVGELSQLQSTSKVDTSRRQGGDTSKNLEVISASVFREDFPKTILTSTQLPARFLLDMSKSCLRPKNEMVE